MKKKIKISKYEIFDYWKDKSITKHGEVKRTIDCTGADEPIKIIECQDDVFCWACQCPPSYEPDTDNLKVIWNKAGHLQKAHILPASKGGNDEPHNLFLLCPNCHADSPDTTNQKNFFAWVYYMRKHESWCMLRKQALMRAVKIKGIDLNLLGGTLEDIDFDFLQIEQQLLERCGAHGSTVSLLSQMMCILDILLEHQAEQQ